MKRHVSSTPKIEKAMTPKDIADLQSLENSHAEVKMAFKENVMGLEEMRLSLLNKQIQLLEMLVAAEAQNSSQPDINASAEDIKPDVSAMDILLMRKPNGEADHARQLQARKVQKMALEKDLAMSQQVLHNLDAVKDKVEKTYGKSADHLKVNSMFKPIAEQALHMDDNADTQDANVCSSIIRRCCTIL